MSNATLGSAVDDNTNAIEAAVADLLGAPLDTNLPVPVRGAVYSEITNATDLGGSGELTFDRSYNLPANTLRVGSVLRMTIAGLLGATATTLTLRFRIGGALMAAVSNIFTSSGNQFWARATCVVRSIAAGVATLHCTSAFGFTPDVFTPLPMVALFPTAEANATATVAIANAIQASAQGNAFGQYKLRQFIIEHLSSLGVS